MPKPTGRLFSIERYAIHDGPGIRTQVFFKGCPLRCLWCSNPEGMSFNPSLVYTRILCIGCNACVDACGHQALSMTGQGLQVDRAKCTLCGDCAAACYAEALQINCFEMTAEAVLAEVERDRVFYAVSVNGGVTLTGGEPMTQPSFAAELLRLCKERGLHTAIETCGHYPFAALEQVLPNLDFVYYDIKHMSPVAHKQYTGVDNNVIQANLRELQSYPVDLCVRVPVIPTINDTLENMEATAAFVKNLPRVQWVELLPYHRLGVNKYRKLGLEYAIEDIPALEKEAVQKLGTVFARYGIACMIQA